MSHFDSLQNDDLLRKLRKTTEKLTKAEGNNVIFESENDVLKTEAVQLK